MGQRWVEIASGINYCNVSASLPATPELGLAVGLWSWDCGTGAVHWSPENYRLHGVDPAITPTWDVWTGAIACEDRPGAIAAARRALMDHQPYGLAYRTKAGFLIGRGKVVLDENGEPAQMVGCNLEASALWHQLSHLRSAAEQLAEGLGADAPEPDDSQVLSGRLRDGLAALVRGLFVSPNK